MDKLLFYASMSARAGRARFWGTTLAAFAIMIALMIVIIALAPARGREGGFVAIWILVIPVLYCLWVMFAVAIRRLHDRGKSAWWVQPYFIAPAVIDAIAEHGVGDAATGPYWMLKLVSLALSLWGFVDIGCLRGTVGDNRFGPDPLVDHAPADIAPMT